MRRLHCVFQDGLILGIWMCPDERFYYHIAEADATEPLTKEEIWDMMAELVKPEDLQILKERAEAIVEGGADK